MRELNYQIEIDAFKKAFTHLKDKKIVFYGIGRRTATLLPAVQEFSIVGLMDKEEENIGKMMYGLPIISLQEAEQKADCIIINSLQLYWKIIFQRIQHAKIPVYYTDGTKAKIEEEDTFVYENSYWEGTMDSLLAKIQEHDVISFDFFDTLIMRDVYMPQGIWEEVQKRVRSEGADSVSFLEWRRQAVSQTIEFCPTIEDIYTTLKDISGLSIEAVQRYMRYEIEEEKKHIVPRKDMLYALKMALEWQKDVYIVSDMYLHKSFMEEVLKKYGVNVPAERIWISCERKKDKNTGEVWRDLKEKSGEKRILHIGDNQVADVKKPKGYGINTCYVMSAAELLMNSSIRNIVPDICSHDAERNVGIIIAKLFNSPFALSDTKGRVRFQDFEEMGYALFGPIVFAYLHWIWKQAYEQGISKLVFFGRDGYFLIKDYQYLCELLKKGIPSEYLEISRRAVMIAAIEDEEDIKDAIRTTYNGSFKEFMEDRFCVQADERTCMENEKWVYTTLDFERIVSLCERYRSEIEKEVQLEKESYLGYLESKKIEGDFAVVDLFYCGNTQYYLSRLLKRRLKGFYLICDMSENNKCRKNNDMSPYFQEKISKKDCDIYTLLESFLTAPNGMLLKTEHGKEFIYGKAGYNQTYFEKREKINEGVKKYMMDVCKCGIYENGERADIKFIDKWYELLCNGAVEFTQAQKDIFYFDNALEYRKEVKMLE